MNMLASGLVAEFQTCNLSIASSTPNYRPTMPHSNQNHNKPTDNEQ